MGHSDIAPGRKTDPGPKFGLAATPGLSPVGDSSQLAVDCRSRTVAPTYGIFDHHCVARGAAILAANAPCLRRGEAISGRQSYPERLGSEPSAQAYVSWVLLPSALVFLLALALDDLTDGFPRVSSMTGPYWCWLPSNRPLLAHSSISTLWRATAPQTSMTRAQTMVWFTICVPSIAGSSRRFCCC